MSNKFASLAGAVILVLAGAILANAQQRPPQPAVAPATSASLVRSPGADGQRVAILQGLDKVTARAQRIVVPVGKSVQFGTLSVAVSECLVNAPDAAPESAVYVTVTDHKPGNPPARLFGGWMFASAPALSSLDHSVYDVTVLGCSTAAQAAAPSSSR
jgi:hypothetical protein